MIEKWLDIATDFEDADRIAREQDNQMTPLDRLAAFMKLMMPYYASAPRLQRIWRVRDRSDRQIYDDWGCRTQPLSKPESDQSQLKDKAWEFNSDKETPGMK